MPRRRRATRLLEAQIVIADWRRDHNDYRPHYALGMLTTTEFAARQPQPTLSFYTGGVVFDLPGLARRLTDLEPCVIERADDPTCLEAETTAGLWPDGRPLVRTTARVPSDCPEAVHMRFDLGSQRPRGIVRVGHLTLLPDAFQGPLWVETTLGGRTERFPLDEDVDHGQPVSLLVSSATSLGGGRGDVRIGDDARALRVTWDPSVCSAVPMLHHRRVGPAHLTPLWFSLAELDDTFREWGQRSSLSRCASNHCETCEVR